MDMPKTEDKPAQPVPTPPLPNAQDQLSVQELFDKCMALASNLWWSWTPEIQQLFRDLDSTRWRQLDHNPIALLREFTAERLYERATEMVMFSRINQAYRRLKEYINDRQTWAATYAGVLGAKPVAYFSAEFGIHESLPIYSGGLGVLSGDHIKSASSLGVPLVAMGLFAMVVWGRLAKAKHKFDHAQAVESALNEVNWAAMEASMRRGVTETQPEPGKKKRKH